ncbi:MAG: hypothetical protein QOE41_142 [Mycobacterium sp.]|nr:hypothetical protein [Mycobacterium sp.]
MLIIASDELRGRLRACSSSWWPGDRLADTAHGAAAAVVGTTVAAAGGGALGLIGVVIAALAVPAFVRYRVDRPRGGSKVRRKRYLTRMSKGRI